LASVHPGDGGRHNQAALQQIILRQLVESEPDHFLIYGRIHFTTQQPGDVFGRVLAVTALPNKGGGFIETMRPILFNIVNQNFAR